MIKKLNYFETITVSPLKASEKLNELNIYCEEIKVINCLMAQDQFQQPQIIMLLELIFKGPISERDFKEKYLKQIPLKVN